MVQNALIHLHKKKASGEPLGQLPLPVPADRPVVRTIGESQGAPTLRENRHSGIAAQTELTAEGKISTKGTAPILLPHPGEQGKDIPGVAVSYFDVILVTEPLLILLKMRQFFSVTRGIIILFLW